MNSEKDDNIINRKDNSKDIKNNYNYKDRGNN